MLLFGIIIILVITIPLAFLYLLTILIHRFALLIILYSVLFSYYTFIIPLSTDIKILGGLFQITILFTQINDTLFS